jgi:hypothetical protein
MTSVLSPLSAHFTATDALVLFQVQARVRIGPVELAVDSSTDASKG